MIDIVYSMWYIIYGYRMVSNIKTAGNLTAKGEIRRMKDMYKLNKEDKRELFSVLMASDEVEVSGEPVIITDNDKERVCREVKIDGKKTMFTERLYNWIVANEVILRV